MTFKGPFQLKQFYDSKSPEVGLCYYPEHLFQTSDTANSPAVHCIFALKFTKRLTLPFLQDTVSAREWLPYYHYYFKSKSNSQICIRISKHLKKQISSVWVWREGYLQG